MRKMLLFAAVIIAAFTGCSKDDTTPQTDDATAKIAAVLNGHFVSKIKTLGNDEIEEVTFKPFASPKEIISLFGTFKAYGTAEISHYYDDHLLETGGSYYYSIEGAVIDGYSSYVSFYKYSGDYVTEGADKREYTPVSATEFKLRESGSAIVKTFVKQ